MLHLKINGTVEKKRKNNRTQSELPQHFVLVITYCTQRHPLHRRPWNEMIWANTQIFSRVKKKISSETPAFLKKEKKDLRARESSPAKLHCTWTRRWCKAVLYRSRRREAAPASHVVASSSYLPLEGKPRGSSFPFSKSWWPLALCCSTFLLCKNER